MEKSAGAIVWYKNKKTKIIEYLLLHYPSLDNTRQGHWDFPKGHVEKGETEIEAATREVAEETGIHELRFLPKFKERIRYFYAREGKKISKEVIFYLAESRAKKVEISFEHVGFAWLPFDKAIEQVTYKNAKEVLQKARQFLTTHQMFF